MIIHNAIPSFKWNMAITEKDADLIRKVKETQGNACQVGLARYTKLKEYTWLFCNRHNEFFKKRIDKAETGCPRCSREVQAEERTTTPEDYIRQCIEKRGDFFDYSKTKFVKGTVKVTITCPLHGDFTKKPFAFLRGSTCPECAKQNRRDKLTYTDEEYAQMLLERQGEHVHVLEHIIMPQSAPGAVYDRYVTAHCDIHDYTWKVPRFRLIHYGCPKCGYAESGRKNLVRTGVKMMRTLQRRFGDIIDFSRAEYGGSWVLMQLKCLKCGKEYQRAPYQLLNKTFCDCMRRTSRGEEAVARWLDEHGYRYEREKRFDTCRDSRPLPFDFWLEDLNTVIEYQGRQHFCPESTFGAHEGEKVYEDLVRHDRIKREWCVANGIREIELLPEWNCEKVLGRLLCASRA